MFLVNNGNRSSEIRPSNTGTLIQLNIWVCCNDSNRFEQIHEFNLQVPWGHIACKWWGSKDIQPIICLHGWQDNAGRLDFLLLIFYFLLNSMNFRHIWPSHTIPSKRSKLSRLWVSWTWFFFAHTTRNDLHIRYIPLHSVVGDTKIQLEASITFRTFVGCNGIVYICCNISASMWYGHQCGSNKAWHANKRLCLGMLSAKH